MATSQEFVDFVVGQLEGCGEVAAKKMFGDYALYVDRKVVGLICDGRLHIKPTEQGDLYLARQGVTLELDSAYPGAKPSFLIGDKVDSRDFLQGLVRLTADALPLPKPKKRRGKDK